ncbi:MAG TPA: hypothetical protein VEO92_00685, partial [Candidatus Nitrosocosmicus sp.]|nr:hypothetical protein [Candidatus Nitrosocosmicus sp.]
MREKESGTITIVLIGGHLENNCQNNDSFVHSGTTQFRRAVTGFDNSRVDATRKALLFFLYQSRGALLVFD